MKRKILMSIMLFSALAMFGSTIYAATFLNYGYPSSTIPIRPYNYTSTWQAPMDASIANWNNAGAKVQFTKSTNSPNTITAGNFNNTAYGVNYASVSGSQVVSFRIELNASTISADATNLSNFIQSVFVHELGHSVWLGDNPTTSSPSIMSYTRNRNSMTKPQTFDINNVRSRY
ncbi:M57 family metalloprotease [Paenibacillus tundrae]